MEHGGGLQCKMAKINPVKDWHRTLQVFSLTAIYNKNPLLFKNYWAVGLLKIPK